MTLRLTIGIAAATLLALSPGPGATAPSPAPTPAPAPPQAGASAPLYYLSLGDSLSVGYQPGAGSTAEGYSEQLLALARRKPEYRGLRLVKLGCPGETTRTLVRGGGSCAYDRGSQLAQAEAFLRRHRGRVAFVTLTIGANDALRCRPTDRACTAAAIRTVEDNLSVALRRLRAASPGTTIVGADYYAPGLALWLTGSDGRARARAYAAELATPGNESLRDTYRRHGARVARVEAAFATHEFDTAEQLPRFGRVPRNVALICRLTWMCERGDIHANADGYRVIAQAFARQLP